MSWQCVLELDHQQRIARGSPSELRQALARGADLRIFSEFYHDEHIDPKAQEHELVQESMDMRVTYLIEDRWAAGILSLRQPVELPERFGPRPSLSLFLYNEDGRQAIARPYLDGPPRTARPGPSPPADHSQMPKYRELDRWDDDTNAPSSNFVYAFQRLRYFVREDWTELLHHTREGQVVSGSMDAVAAAVASGAEFKIGIRGLSDDLMAAGQACLDHEVFVQLGSCYLYTDRQWFIAGTHPIPRVRPAVPLSYTSQGWDYSWALVRSDGHAALLSYDPYTLQPREHVHRFEMRWFSR